MGLRGAMTKKMGERMGRGWQGSGGLAFFSGWGLAPCLAWLGGRTFTFLCERMTNSQVFVLVINVSVCH